MGTENIFYCYFVTLVTFFKAIIYILSSETIFSVQASFDPSILELCQKITTNYLIIIHFVQFENLRDTGLMLLYYCTPVTICIWNKKANHKKKKKKKKKK